jgi:hypothetical protein
LTLLLLASANPARAQIPRPHVDDVEKRSGLMTRFVPIQPWLPPDKRRDTFFDTRFADCPDTHPNHPNTIKGGGLYGRAWPGYCTASYYPYFWGSPGQSTIGPGCKPCHPLLRAPQALLHPFRPIDYYYDQGSHVPLYDLDPIVPGPGPVPYWFPFYLKNPHGG